MIVVTLTSWLKRIQNIKAVLQSVLNQTLKADRIYLNLSKEEFKDTPLPKDLVIFIKSNPKIILNWVEGPNTKAFKKIFPILKFLTDEDIIIDIDDDFVVPHNFIDSRVKDFKRYRTSITGGRATINGYADGLLPEMEHYFIAGSLFQKKMFNHWEDILDEEIIKTNHDDAFYDFLVFLNGYIPEKCTECFTDEFKHPFTTTPSLHGTIGCANAIKATTINIKKFKNKFKTDPCYNYFKTNPHPQTFTDRALKRPIKFLMLDRGRKAGDNGEYFYRWLKENKPEINIRYLLRKTSSDWERLKKDGFNLVDIEDKLAVQKEVNTSDYLCFSYFPRDVMGGIDVDKLVQVFLNHGCFFRFLSYLKTREEKFDLMLAGNQLEYDELIKTYHFSTSKIALTGQPRQDSLIKLNKQYSEKQNNVLIQFWWRPWLKASREDFIKSDFYKNVSALLSDSRLKEYAQKYNVNFLFKLHCEMELYADLFKKFTNVTLIPNNALFEDLFIKSNLIVTDFTSNVYEMGMIEKPCIYFRPDWSSMKKELIKKDGSYFDVKERGIGPTADTVEEFFLELEKMLKNNYQLDDIYNQRRKNQITFIQNDHCCERAFNAIIKISSKNQNREAYKSIAPPKIISKDHTAINDGLPTLNDFAGWF